MPDEPSLPPPTARGVLTSLKAHRLYRVAIGYILGAWVALQVAAIVLPGFGAPPWVLRGLIILLTLGLGEALLVGWGFDRRAAGLPLWPRAAWARVAWGAAAILPAGLVTAFFLERPVPAPVLKAAPAPMAVTMPDAPEKSIAVLPFDNFSEDKDSAFFADGVQDEILTDLAHVADLKVISRSSVMQYKDAKQRNLHEVGRALNVAYLVEGSVQRAGNKIRVVAQLIDARTDSHKWAEHYDRDLADVFTIQSEIAGDIAGQLRLVISPQEHAAMMEVPTHDEMAYQLYLRAIAEFNATGIGAGNGRPVTERVVELLKEATARDPGFVRAFTMLTAVQAYYYYLFEHTPAVAEATRMASEAVARLRPGSAEANLAMGYYDYYVRRDYQKAAQEFAEVTRQSPNESRAWNCLGAIARRQGRWEDALTSLRHAMELDPEIDSPFDNGIELLRALRRNREAETLLDRRIATHPQQVGLHALKVEFLLESRTDLRAARAELAFLPQANDPDGVAAYAHLYCDFADHDLAAVARDLAACPLPEIGNEPRQFYEAYLARARHDAPAAKAAFAAARSGLETQSREQPDNFFVLAQLAMADAGAGNRDAAMAGVRRAVALTNGDTIDEPNMKTAQAIVLGAAGARDEAIGVLREIVGKPFGPEYGFLRLHPTWEPLRGDARFEAIIASLAPTEKL